MECHGDEILRRNFPLAWDCNVSCLIPSTSAIQQYCRRYMRFTEWRQSLTTSSSIAYHKDLVVEGFCLSHDGKLLLRTKRLFVLHLSVRFQFASVPQWLVHCSATSRFWVQSQVGMKFVSYANLIGLTNSNKLMCCPQWIPVVLCQTFFFYKVKVKSTTLH